uniref:Putative lipocalin-8 1 n=1 Tax=Amblyomma triste TaxID=251400 RepID=A0A023GCJ2_AMBTT
MLCGVLFFTMAGCSLVAASVQTPELTPCSDSEDVDISDVTISDAKIGEKMYLNFTLKVSRQLDSDPKLELTIIKENGDEVPCFDGVGSCTYKLCDGETDLEMALGQLWDNKCPVPEITAPASLGLTLNPIIEFAIGKAPTTVTLRLKVTDGGQNVGCESFKFDVEKADS